MDKLPIEEPISVEYLAEQVLNLRQQLFATAELANKQTEVVQELLDTIKKQNEDLSSAKGFIYQLQSKLTDLESKYYSNVGYGPIYLNDGSYYSVAEAIKKIDQRISVETHQQYEMMKVFDALVQTCIAVFKTLPEADRAEAISQMASGLNGMDKPGSVIPQYIFNQMPLDHMLQIAAEMLDQPKSILSLYK